MLATSSRRTLVPLYPATFRHRQLEMQSLAWMDVHPEPPPFCIRDSSQQGCFIDQDADYLNGTCRMWVMDDRA